VSMAAVVMTIGICSGVNGGRMVNVARVGGLRKNGGEREGDEKESRGEHAG